MVLQPAVVLAKLHVLISGFSRHLRAWGAAEQGRFGLWLAVFLGAGVVLYFARRTEPPYWAGAAVAGPAILGSVLARAHRLAHGMLLAVAAAAIGFASCQFATDQALPVEPLPSRGVTVSGRVREVLTTATELETILGELVDHGVLSVVSADDDGVIERRFTFHSRLVRDAASAALPESDRAFVVSRAGAAGAPGSRA